MARKAESKISGGRISISPMDFEFTASIDKTNKPDTKMYRLTVTKGRSTTFKDFRLIRRDRKAPAFTLEATNTEVPVRESMTFTVKFAPTKEKVYCPELEFKEQRGKGRSFRSTTHRIRLRGEGTKSPVVQGPATDAPNGDSNLGDDTDGGADPGSAPPTGYCGPTTTLCVRFWRLPGFALDRPTAEGWITGVNAIFADSGVSFELSRRDILVSPAPGKEFDRHCINVYVGGADALDGDRAGETLVSNSRADKAVIEKAVVHPAFLAASSGFGTQIVVEGLAATVVRALAHELGHFLGLGPVPDEQASPQQHLDPSDGMPITNAMRLLLPVNSGTNLTSRERRVARFAAVELKKRMSRCDRTEVRFETALAIGDIFEEFSVISRQEQLQVVGFAAEPFTIDDEPWRLDVQVQRPAADGDSWAASYRWNGSRWHIGSTIPDDLDARVLTEPGFMTSMAPADPATARTRVGFTVDVPKSHFGITSGVVEVRGRVRKEGSPWQEFPNDGWIPLDLTAPGFVLDLDDDSLLVCADVERQVGLSGSLWRSSTTASPISVWLSAPGRCGPVSIPVAELVDLSQTTWQAELVLPPEVPAGRMRAKLVASCPECGIETGRGLVIDVA